MQTFEGHTPGPWGTSRRDNGAIIRSGSYEVAYVPNGSAKVGTETGKANAALLAAAPTLLRQRDTLLDELRAVESYLEYVQGHIGGKIGEGAAVRLISVKHAIALCESEAT